MSRLGSHVTAMLLVGAKVNQAGAIYLESGYSGLWGKTTLLSGLVGGAGVSGSIKYRVDVGIAGIGFRHYFMGNVFLDVSYDYALYKNKSGSSSDTISTTVVGKTVNNLKRVAINGITATANYLFNI